MAQQDTTDTDRPFAATTRDELLAHWFSQVDNVTLACWDEGHFWDMGARDTTFVSTTAGAWGARERCHRRVDGVTCKVRRVRYLNPVSGYLDGPGAFYDYGGYTPSRPYRLPKGSSGYSILDRHTRAAIRMERKRRQHLGEDVGGKLAEETN